MKFESIDMRDFRLMGPMCGSFWALCLCYLSTTGLVPVGADDLFHETVAPLLERHCLACHDERERKGGLSLQRADSVLSSGVIEKGDPDASLLIELVTPVDGEARMPLEADSLSAAEIAVLREWIEQGAGWPAGIELEQPSVSDFAWWSYQPLSKPDIPAANDSWVANPVDAFIHRRLQEQGLTHSPPADRRTLIRRVTYDLIGLPPTPAEVDAFVRDPAADAYESLVNRLLDSKHYGERWARHWLDVVGYADTCGYDKDKLRPNAWPYRDYIIRSFNADKPYSQFVKEQIAGDVLFPGEPDGILGLGFIAAGPWDHIGHVEVPETKIDGKVARNLDRDDMVSRTLNTFCSVTAQCARCHNHKFDPITQQHYYGLQAIFAAVDRAERTYDVDPAIERQRHELEEQLRELRHERVAVDEEISAAGGERLAELDAKIADIRPHLKTVKTPAFGFHSQLTATPDQTKWVEVELEDVVTIESIRLHPCHDDFANIGAGFGFPVRFRIEIATEHDDWTTVFEQTDRDYSNPGLRPVTVQGHQHEAKYIRITATRLAERRNDYFFALAEVEVLDSGGANRAQGARVTALDSIEASPRWGKQNLVDGSWARPADEELAQQNAALVGERRELMKVLETPERLARRAALTEQIEDTEAALAALPAGKRVYAAATHFTPRGNFKPTAGELRPIHVLHRGNVQQPGDPAIPGVLPLSADADWRLDADLDEGERRAALARWLTDENNPLVWRSIVNRVWLYHFGEGLVATPNDFGRMGAEPTYPELLDWLACTFRDNGQSIKSLHRLIVLSNAYRQSSANNEANAAIDAGNRFFWRMDRRRLSAEEIRDSILAVSGALDRSMGGPGFYLFKLEKDEHSPHYEYHKFDPADESTHRRSIYRFIVRSQPDPWMSTLDCADSSQSTPRRSETLTALQALSLLNNRFSLEMARRFAERLRDSSSDIDAQIERAMRLLLQRAPTTPERDAMKEYAEAHGLENLCRWLFNLNEFLYLD